MIEAEAPRTDGRCGLCAQQDEAGRVALGVGDVGRDYPAVVEVMARSVPIAPHGSSEAPTVSTASAVEFAATISASGHRARRNSWHWAVARVRARARSPGATSARAIRWWRTVHDLGADPQAAVGRGEVVERLVDRALDRVLDRDEGLGDLALAHGPEALDDGREGDGLPGLAESDQRLLGERPGRPEVADPHALSRLAGRPLLDLAGGLAVAGRLGDLASRGGGTGRPSAIATARSSSGERRWLGVPSAISLR